MKNSIIKTLSVAAVCTGVMGMASLASAAGQRFHSGFRPSVHVGIGLGFRAHLGIGIGTWDPYYPAYPVYSDYPVYPIYEPYYRHHYYGPSVIIGGHSRYYGGHEVRSFSRYRHR